MLLWLLLQEVEILRFWLVLTSFLSHGLVLLNFRKDFTGENVCLTDNNKSMALIQFISRS